MSDSATTPQARLAPLLQQLAQLAERDAEPSDTDLEPLLAGLEGDPASGALVRRCLSLLRQVRRSVAATREMAIDSLLLCGLPERAVQEAVDAVAGVPAAGLPSSAAQWASPAPLHCTVDRLDLGTVEPDQQVSAEFDVHGGPGRIMAEPQGVTVSPTQFGPGATRVRVTVPPLPEGVLLGTLRLVTTADYQEVPLFARWQAEPLAAAGAAGGTAAAGGGPPRPLPRSAADTPRVLVRTTLAISQVTGFPRALALQRAIQQLPGVAEIKALGYERGVLHLQVQHEATANLAELVGNLPGFPISVVGSSLGRLDLAAEGR